MGGCKEPGAEAFSTEERTKDNGWKLVLQEEGVGTEGTTKGTGLRKRSRKETKLDMHIRLQLEKGNFSEFSSIVLFLVESKTTFAV